MTIMDDQDAHIAVVGLAARAPRAADLDEFWQRLAAGEECLTRFPGAAGRATAYGVVEGADGFDAAFFGFSPREALLLDPQHRVFLECAWEALEHAGYDPSATPGVVGVYGGCGDTGHFGTLRANAHRLPDVSDWQMRLASGNDFLTSRVSYKLGLTGPAMTVQTACSTSLVAVHTAVAALLAGECDLALAGGVTVRVPLRPGEVGDDGILAPDGHCRAFDADASGTVGGDGAGVVALKRLSDALADGDHVHAVIRGSAVNNDGAAKMGFTAPSVDGQAAAVRAAHLVAGVRPADISYVEAHGTGTPVGDPIEVRALAKAFGENVASGSVLLGSVKSNIGHTDAAAGVLGLIKVVLSLRHEQLPGTVHFRTPNPGIDFAGGPFRVSGTAQPWPRAGSARIAGVNALGIGGTNAHVIVQEPPLPEPADPAGAAQLLPISARSRAALGEAARRLAAVLRAGEADLADVAWTLQNGRTAFAHRGFVVAADPAAAAAELTRPGLVTGRAAQQAEVAFLFPGQGGQHVRMARELYDTEDVFRTELDRVAELAAPGLGLDIRTVLYPDRDDEAATARATAAFATMHLSQPALFAVQWALAALWRSRGVTPSTVLGHSLGAYAAAAVAGVLTPEDAVTLVLARSRLLQDLPAGAMLAVGLPEAQLLPLLGGRLSIAAINAPGQCVVAGPAGDVAELRDRLAARDVDARLLRISAAAHSSLVEPVMAEYSEVVSRVRLSPPSLLWISDRTGAPVTAEQACDPAYWAAHLRHTVRFGDALGRLLESSDAPLVEIGPGRTLGSLARQHPACRDERTVVASLPHPVDPASSAETMLAAAGRLWLAGVVLDWPSLHHGQPRRRVPLPTYPFERQRFLLDPPTDPTGDDRDAANLPDAADDIDDGLAFDRPDDDFVAPGTPAEHAVAALFGRLLGLREVSVHDNFFDLGGDSLIAGRLVAQLREGHGGVLTVRDVLRAATVAEVACLLDAQAAEAALPADATGVGELLPAGRPA
jgi:phthiocerol/phenolphthiocerol synthesis type-I polyketide synthase E